MQFTTTLLLFMGAAIAQEKPLCEICLCFGVNVECIGKAFEQVPVTSDAWPSYVEEASFEQNALSHVPVLPPLLHLRKLSFRHNRISHVDNGAFAQLPQLQLLDLGFNLLSSLSLSPRNLSVAALEDASAALKELRVLRLNSNAFESLPGNFFAWVPELRELSLGGNPMRSLDAATVAALGSLTALEELDLSRMGLRALPENMLSRLANLRELDLSGNELTMVPSALAELHQLRALTLSSNPIRAIELGSFPQTLATLQSLVLEDMGKLVRVGGRSLETLTGLRSLVLADSPSLAEIEPDAFVGDISSPSKFPALERLILRGNSLRTLHHIFLPSIDNLVEVDLRDNLWQCDCNLNWIIIALEPIISKNNPEMLLNVICNGPQNLHGYNLFSQEVAFTFKTCGGTGDGFTGYNPGVFLLLCEFLLVFAFWKRF